MSVGCQINLIQEKSLKPVSSCGIDPSDADAKPFADAVTATGGKVGTTEPIMTLAQRFEKSLELPLAHQLTPLTVVRIWRLPPVS